MPSRLEIERLNDSTATLVRIFAPKTVKRLGQIRFNQFFFKMFTELNDS